MTSDTTLDRGIDSLNPSGTTESSGWCLVMVWNRRQAGVAGEVARIRGRAVLGRVGGQLGVRSDGRDEPLRWARERPCRVTPGEGIRSTYISREQLHIRALGPAAMQLRNVGRLTLRVNGHETRSGQVVDGDVIELDGEVVLLVQRRAETPDADGSDATTPFGAPCEDGLVGEGPAMATLRRAIRRVGPLPGHVLVTGASGTGKELVARALHRHSARTGAWVPCNAAAIPDGVAAAEWFGNVRNYPNAGMPARDGLAAMADRGTLFIDEIGELPTAVQAQLLRLLDSGELQRLGASKPNRVDLRVVAATNRGPEALKHDVAARFPLRVQTPGLDARPEDIPLLVQHLLRGPGFDRFVRDGVSRITPRFWRVLLNHLWTGHVRELLQLLHQSAEAAQGDWLDAPNAPAPKPPPANPDAITPDDIERALAANDGVKTRAAEALGLRNRHQLRRLMARYGMT